MRCTRPEARELTVSNRKQSTCLAVIALGFVAGCDDGASAPAPAIPPPPTIAQLESATVAGVFASPVTLAHGRYDGPPAQPGAASHPSLTLLTSPIATGDVDGTPGDETVAMLASDEGGSGTVVWVAVFAHRDGRLLNLATAAVGDRVRPQQLAVRQGRIVMDVVEHGPSDPACCPTQAARRTYSMTGGVLSLD
jgi:hypothetical protein